MHGDAKTAPGEPGLGTASLVLRRLAAIAAIVALLIVALLLIFGGDGGHRYRLVFETGGQLVPDNQVLIGGHPVGSVESIDLDDEARAIVDVEIDQQLHEGSTAMIRATSLAGIANRYVSISPGPNNERALADGATLGPESTTSPVDIDQLFAAFGSRTRQGLGRFIRGQAAVYEGKGGQANASYKYLQPALSRTDAVLRELNADQRLFRGFITSSARLFTALGDRHDDLEQSVSNANTAFGTIARENVELDRSLRLLAPTFRQSNTTFVNLRAALDDLERLVDTAKPATENLAPFLARLRPVVSEAVPVFTDLRETVAKPGPANDLNELFATLPAVQGRAGPAFGRAERAIADFQPTLDFARPYTPDLLNALAKLGQITAYYDANGHYARAGVADLNLFSYEPGSGSLDALAATDQYEPLGQAQVPSRCPGAATATATDDSNPFVAPLWPDSGLGAGDCDPDDIPPVP
jgi:phospholipid/cholesterol/gamma-HCH transport system substrate-binding protein